MRKRTFPISATVSDPQKKKAGRSGTLPSQCKEPGRLAARSVPSGRVLTGQIPVPALPRIEPDLEQLESVVLDVPEIGYEVAYIEDPSRFCVAVAERRDLHRTLRALDIHLFRGAGVIDSVYVRIPLIPDMNDDEANLRESAELLASLPTITGVGLMGYHDIAAAKYEALGMSYRLNGTKPPTADHMQQAGSILEEYGLKVKIS